MYTFTTSENPQERITQHALPDGRKSFFVQAIQQSLPYVVVSANMDPNVPVFWGHYQGTNGKRVNETIFFVSEKVPKGFHTTILNLAYSQSVRTQSHLQAVQNLLEHIKHGKTKIAETLLRYYEWAEDSHRHSPTEIPDDIAGTVTYLRNLLPKSVPV